MTRRALVSVHSTPLAPNSSEVVMRSRSYSIPLVLSLSLLACTGDTGPAGPPGMDGADGSPGADGADGADGSPGADGADGAPGGCLSASTLPLVGSAFYPEGVAADTDGGLYVGSIATGEVVRFAPCDVVPEVIVAAGTLVRNAVGLLVDRDESVLWACDSDVTFASPAALVGIDLATGAERARHVFEAGSFCNDLAQAADGTLYATDSSRHAIVRVDGDARFEDGEVEVWSDDAAFTRPMGEFGLNGVVVADDAVYAVVYASGQLFRVPFADGGAAGAPSEVTLDRALRLPDGVEWLGDDLLVVEGSGALSRVALAEGTVTELATRLDTPATVAIVGRSAWITEGQLDHLLGFDPSPALLPFQLVRVTLPE